MLYGDGHYWPRVWSQNKAITNPHLVRQGHVLQFLLGSEDQAPAFRFSEDDGGGLELAANTSQNPIVEIPPPEVPPKPVLKMPTSFPAWQQMFIKPPVQVIDYSALGRTRGEFAQRMYLAAYVQETPVQPIGEFLEIDGEAGLPIANQYVYVKIKKGAAQVGEKLLVVKDQGKIQHVSPTWTEKLDAYLVHISAELELTEPVRSEFKRQKDAEYYDTYRALITRTTGLTFKNSSIIPGTLQTVDLSMSGPSGNVAAQVIGAAKHEASAMYGPGEVVFLNKGASHGLEVGQILDVFAKRESRHRDTPVPESPAPSGTLKVVRVSERLATAVLLKAREGIQQGDEARQVSSHAASDQRATGPVPTDANAAPAEGGDQIDDATSPEPSGGDEDIEREMQDSDVY
jgi:hypothetical protein